MQKHKSKRLLPQADTENTLLICFYKSIIWIPAGPCHSPAMWVCNGWHVLPGWPLLVCQVLGFLGRKRASVFTRESYTSWFFFEADEKYWMKPTKSRETASSCRRGHILPHAPPWDYLALAFCDRRWGKTNSRWDHHGPTQLVNQKDF